MGGGVLRTAAKVASTGSFRSPLVGEASRRAARQQASSFVPAVEQGLTVPNLSSGPTLSETPAVAVATHWPDWEFDEWELAGDKEQSLSADDVAPRLVFGPVPTLEEAKEATADLKDALEKVYFVPDHTLDSHGGDQATACGESGTVSAVPGHVVQMFSLLRGSSEAQEVVASLAADKNVWDAVMNNEKFLKFCNNPSPAVAQIYGDPAESVAENKPDFSPTVEVEETSEVSLLDSIKVKVSQIVSHISDYVQDFFGISSASGETATSSTDHKYINMTLGTSFMALAVATILVVLLKRG
ncbi:hypothetical protein IEQ34_011113 [Dendrobium chrysotoxum]|uniref:Uncharacterized protein n=1 Tax=Dendrobium chrysotoxum TaxID=161865 RepID=A0AAV7GWJ8_DENCH|nr:hypothetical protein IEQ34_011113 [Dendrobium chrysotoxum]